MEGRSRGTDPTAAAGLAGAGPAPPWQASPARHLVHVRRLASSAARTLGQNHALVSGILGIVVEPPKLSIRGTLEVVVSSHRGAGLLGVRFVQLWKSW